MPFRNILAIALALALGQAAWAQTPTGHPEVQYKDAPDFGDPTTGGGEPNQKAKKNCENKADNAWTDCKNKAKGNEGLIKICDETWRQARWVCNQLYGNGD